MLKIEKGTNKLVSVIPDNPNGAIVSHIEFQCSEVDKRCGDVEYVDGKIERIHNEAGWTDGKGRYVAAIRDARGSLRATWTKREVPTSPGTVNVQLMHYDNLTAYYPYGLPWADRQGGSRDQYEGKELERFAGLLTYDFHARRYDPQLCLFQGPDPLAINYSAFNPYLYCAANPISLTDPTGCIIIPMMESHELDEYNSMMQELRQQPHFNHLIETLDADEREIYVNSGVGQTNAQGGTSPAKYSYEDKTITLDFSICSAANVIEEFYHSYQDMFADVLDPSYNMEYEAKIFSDGVCNDLMYNPSYYFRGFGNNPNLDGLPIYKEFCIYGNFSLDKLLTPEIQDTYIQGGQIFSSRWKLGPKIPFSYDRPVNYVPPTLFNVLDIDK